MRYFIKFFEMIYWFNYKLTFFSISIKKQRKTWLKRVALRVYEDIKNDLNN